MPTAPPAEDHAPQPASGQLTQPAADPPLILDTVDLGDGEDGSVAYIKVDGRGPRGATQPVEYYESGMLVAPSNQVDWSKMPEYESGPVSAGPDSPSMSGLRMPVGAITTPPPLHPFREPPSKAI